MNQQRESYIKEFYILNSDEYRRAVNLLGGSVDCGKLLGIGRSTLFHRVRVGSCITLEMSIAMLTLLTKFDKVTDFENKVDQTNFGPRASRTSLVYCCQSCGRPYPSVEEYQVICDICKPK